MNKGCKNRSTLFLIDLPNCTCCGEFGWLDFFCRVKNRRIRCWFTPANGIFSFNFTMRSILVFVSLTSVDVSRVKVNYYPSTCLTSKSDFTP